MNKFFALCAILLMSASAKAASYVSTDVLCSSGAEVNFAETVPVGKTFDLDNVELAKVELGKKVNRKILLNMIPGSPRLRASLARDPKQLLMFASTISEIGYSYESGRGPCPLGDKIIILAKHVD